MRLRRIVINDFYRFKYVEIDFEKFTSVNGKIVSRDGLKFLSEAIKFVLDCSELSPKNLLNSIAECNETAGMSTTYVEADIIYPDGIQRKFIKKISGSSFVFQINEVNVAQQQYKEELLKSKVLTLPLNTLSIGPLSVNKVATLTELKRAAFIERFSDSEKLIKKYKDLSVFIESTKIELDASLKNKIALIAEKKNVDAKKAMGNKRAQLINELEMKSKEFDLFCIYHNEKVLNSAFDETSTRELHLDELKNSLSLSLQATNQLIAEETNCHREKILSVAQLELAREELKTGFKEMICKDTNTYVLDEILEEDVAMTKANIRQQIEKLDLLNENPEKLEIARKEFQQLQANFDAINAMEQFDLLNMTRIAQVSKTKPLKDSIDENHKNAEKISKEVSTIDEELEATFRKRQEKQLTKENIEVKQKKVYELTQHLHKLQNEAALKHEAFSANSRQKIIDELKKKFLVSIIGRISELVKPSTGVSQKFVNDRLGKFANAIVVDTVETVEACVEHLKTKQFSFIDEIFLPLDELTKKQKASKDFMSIENLPANVDFVCIEDLVETLKEHEKILLYCLKPSVVVNSQDDVETLLKLSDTKKLDVVCIGTSTCFRKQGFMEVTGEINELENLDEIILNVEMNLEVLKAELVQLVPLRALLSREISILDAQIKRLEQSKNPYNELSNFYNKEKQSSYDEYNEIVSILDPLKTKLYSEMNSKLEAKKLNHFSNFCKDLKIVSSDDFQEESSQNSVEIKTEALKEKFMTCEDDEAFFKDIIDQITFGNSDVQVGTLDEFQLEQNLADKKQKLSESIENVCSNIKISFEMSERVAREKRIGHDLTSEISDIYEQMYDDLNNVQMSLKENYEILIHNFASHSSLLLKSGDFGNFIVPPDDVPAKFHLVSEQLKTVEINFDHLKSSLKNVSEKATKVHSMVNNISKLKESLEQYTGKVSETVSDQRFARVTEDLKEAIKDHESLQQKMTQLNEMMKVVKEERKKKFDDNLKALNEGISEFCKLAFGQQIVANLEATNESEPYLGEIVYFWRSLDDIDSRVSEFFPDPVAALVFLFAILKMKKQSFVILEDALKSVVNVASLEKFMRQQNYIQIVSLTSQITDETSNYIIREKSQTYAVTRLN